MTIIIILLALILFAIAPQFVMFLIAMTAGIGLLSALIAVVSLAVL